MPHATLWTPRLELLPITVAIVEAVMTGRQQAVEAIVGAKVPAAWPGRALVERAFSASLERIHADPEVRLWGDRLMVTRDDDRRIVGSVIFHGRPGEDGIAEVGYGVEEQHQGRGLATEATDASVAWALAHEGVRLVRATTPPWHQASIRVLEKSGFTRKGSEEHDTLGEVLVFERTR